MFFKFEKFIFKIEKLIITALLAVMFVTVLMQVFVRYFNLPIINTTEVSLMAMSVMTFFGVGIAVYTRDHIAVEVGELFKSRKVRFLFELFSILFMIVFIGVFLVLGYSLYAYSVEGGERTLELGLPLYIPYGSLLLGLIFMLIHLISSLISMFGKSHKIEATENIMIEG